MKKTNAENVPLNIHNVLTVCKENIPCIFFDKQFGFFFYFVFGNKSNVISKEVLTYPYK